MVTELHWIEGPWRGRLAIAARPRGGDWIEYEIAGWRHEGVNVVVSLLTDQESLEFDLQREAEICRADGVEFIGFPIEDRTSPNSDSETLSLLGKLSSLLHSGKNAVAHCRQGVGRSSLIAIAALLYEGTSLNDAVSEVGRARDVPVPETAGQHKWLEHFESLRQLSISNRVDGHEQAIRISPA
jgi:protein-tyrosine phosphatase